MIRSRLSALICLLLPLLVSGCSSEYEPSADENIHRLVKEVVVAHGGEAALSKIKGYLAEGQLYAPHRNARLRTRRWFGRPDHLLLELDYPGQPEWRLTLGKLSWKGSAPESLSPATGPMIWSMRLQTARFDIPLRLLENEKALTLEEPDGQGRQVLRHNLGDGLAMAYHLDPESKRVVKMTMTMAGPPSMTFEADYFNFKEVEGVYLAHGEVTRASGTITSRVTIDKFIINPPELSEKFMAPGSF